MNRSIALGVGLLVALVALTAVVPGAWGGADGEAQEVIEAENPDYEPWTTPLWAPPSGEIESLLFSLQAGIGGLVIGYFVGTFRTRDVPDA